MSRLLGTPEERWSLRQAIDAVVDAAQRAGSRPWLWIPGIIYPSLSLSLGLLGTLLHSTAQAVGLDVKFSVFDGSVFFQGLPAVIDMGRGEDSIVFLFLFTAAVFLCVIPLYRIIVGLARLADPDLAAGLDERRDPLTLRGTWHAGRGQGLTAYGLWLLVSLFQVLAFSIVMAPLLAAIRSFDLPAGYLPIVVLFVLPVAAIIWLYAILLQVVLQLALMSLAHNRRGVLSALTHGWRLVRASPWAAYRALVVDLLLFLLMMALGFAVVIFVFEPLETILNLASLGFFGLTRAGYWAAVYRSLGGASTVPLLEPPPRANPEPA